MDLSTLADLYDAFMYMWLNKPHGTAFHISRNSSDWIVMLGKCGAFKWRATICIGPRGGISCGFDFVDDRDPSLPSADRIESCSPTSVLFTKFPFAMPQSHTGERADVILASKTTLETFYSQVEAGSFSEEKLITLKNLIQTRRGTSGPASFQGGGCNPR